mgnify:CR=1 FL=1
MMVVSKQQKIFFDFLRFCIGSTKEIPSSHEGGGLEEAICYCPKAMPGRCSF